MPAVSCTRLALSLLVLTALFVGEGCTLEKGSTAGVQFRQDERASLKERFSRLYEQVRPGLQNLLGSTSTSHDDDLQDCAARAFEKLLDREGGSVSASTDVVRVNRLSAADAEMFGIIGELSEHPLLEGQIGRVAVYEEDNWGEFMKQIGELDSPRASFGMCNRMVDGSLEEHFVLGMLVSSEEDGAATLAASCLAAMAAMAFPQCPSVEETFSGTSDHVMVLVRESTDGALCGVVRQFREESAESLYERERVFQRAYGELHLKYSDFATTAMDSDCPAFRTANPECDAVLLRAYNAAPGAEAAPKREEGNEKKRLEFVEYGRYVGRALGEFHREGKALLADKEFVSINQILRLQIHTVEHTVNGILGSFYRTSDGETEFDSVGLASLLYELEQCVKRHPALHFHVTTIHGDPTPLNILVEREPALFRDPTGVFPDVEYERPVGRLHFIDYGEGGVGVGVSDVYYAMTLAQLRAPPNAMVTAEAVGALWRAYLEEYPFKVAPIVQRYYRYMSALSLAWRATAIDVAKVLPEFSALDPSDVVCEDHELIRSQVLNTFTGEETPADLEARFDALLSRRFSAQYQGGDVTALSIVFDTALHANEA
mmetsp:Transcript_22702/g.89786  ORF Transcript_22702/g.89786 Transcript_22702/m.89786 type:complete len:602 (+) Transcript_22702:113-1918(+)